MMSIEDLDKNVNVNFRVPLAYREALKAKAAEQGINLSKFFRNCMDEALNTQNKNFIPAKSKASRADKVFSMRIDDRTLTEFKELCDRKGLDYSKVVRSFVVALLPSSDVTIDDCLFYLVVFLRKALKEQGFILTDLRDIQIQRLESEQPLIQEEDTKRSRVFKVYDKESHKLYTIPFHKI